MDMIPLKVSARDNAFKAKVLRKSNQVPCVVYGNEVKNMSLQCGYNDLFRVYLKAGESTLVDLDFGGKNVPVLFHAVQFDPISDRITHVDFYAVDMKKEIEASVPVHFEGEAFAVKDLGAILVTPQDHVTVKCLPAHLPHFLSVSLEPLKAFHDSLTVADIIVPENVVILLDTGVVIATVQEPRKEEVVEVAPVEGAVEAVEGEGGEAKEGEEGGEEGEEKKSAS
ncbi:hypothetical protein A2454_04420 [Candidatus Peribacteria bacterium RIFOXYC2_FULL_55_14]|nr:MAG: 50S ribosomal protein L25 [Candidatus Peribacteria bacterium GW2011_GWB1_54_5]KKW40755.1 MAG: 50S ribosomal protein L25 [Candidatus Peribacteria bacterium GW2011_GWC2_54_8]KKW41468.1 MAG: 50S ribosomal protein L25 [Candidatus Peregrinibacteria bacterium GW2011_GWA2_54_9]OGJ70956.1 MAG: hypothetical protein A2198_00940 [Candidatus Peribacteria bacterium RIFOXYA1_FULL_56_14]OGJ74251.1 MAG: hypothetical protein A2384_05975 [Candidatus Peribacteria bacterium RIFOXYB1_FULL_54_35]OGJ75215.1 